MNTLMREDSQRMLSGADNNHGQGEQPVGIDSNITNDRDGYDEPIHQQCFDKLPGVDRQTLLDHMLHVEEIFGCLIALQPWQEMFLRGFCRLFHIISLSNSTAPANSENGLYSSSETNLKETSLPFCMRISRFLSSK